MSTRSLALALLASTTLACSRWQTVPVGEIESRETLGTVRVMLPDSSVCILSDAEMQSDQVVGSLDGDRTEIPRRSVMRLDRRELDGVATTVAATVGLAAVLATAQIIFVSQMGIGPPPVAAR